MVSLGSLGRIKSRQVLVALFVLAGIFLLCQYGRNYGQDDVAIEYKPIVGNFQYDSRHKFWDNVFEVIEKTRIKVKDQDNAIKFTETTEKSKHTKKGLLTRATISPEVIEEFTIKHKQFLDELPDKWLESTYRKGTTGVVLIGGGKFSWLSYLSILSLRRMGSRLPVEVIMPRYDDMAKESEFCINTLPALNAACVVLPDVVGAQVMNKWHNNINSFALKSLALLLTSFENVLLLDSDNILLRNPDPIFSSSVYKSYGMITWPDYWRRSMSPIFYDIAGIEVDESRRVRHNRFPITPTKVGQDEQVPFHDLDGTVPDLSTESGQLVINKATHFSTLLLSLYYNMNGPKLYYRLFSLGDQGAGDKDTFPAAAAVFKQPFYAVKTSIKTVGYADIEGKFQGVGMGQSDPLIDFQKSQELLVDPLNGKLKNTPIDKQIERLNELEGKEFSASASLFTLHCNWPKLDPLNLMEREDLFDSSNQRLRYRMYGGFVYDDPKIKEGKIDFELEQWRAMQEKLCVESVYFIHFHKTDIEALCAFINNQVNWLNKGA